MADAYLGPKVVDGLIRYHSVSSLDRADPRQSGCVRKFWYRYVARIKQADDSNTLAGKALHSELAAYERTGVPALSALALSGLHIVPEPGADLLVEQAIHVVDKTGIKSLIGAAGIPLVGFVDCAHARRTNKGGEDIEQQYDPPGTIEVIDWKWKKDGSKVEYVLEPKELIRTIQMPGYGLALGRHFGASYVRLSHGYFPATRGKPRKVTRLHVLDDCAHAWEYVEGLGRTLNDVARETSPERVPANHHACDRYGGCPYRGAPTSCTGYQQQSLSSLFGETAGKDLAMGLISTLPQQPGALVTPAPGAQPAVDVRLQLAAEEQAQRTQATQQQVGITFATAWAAIERSGRGFPSLGGGAAAARAQMLGHTINPQTQGYGGAGDLGGILFTDPLHVIQLGTEMIAASQPTPVAQPQPIAAPAVTHVQHNTVAPMTSVLPPDAPASNPALAAKPVEGFSPPQMFAQQLASPQPMAPAPQTFTMPTAPAQPQPAMFGTPPVAPVEKPKRTRKPKVSPAAPSAGSLAGNGPEASGSAPAGDLEVYVDCVPNGDYESLHPYVDAILAKLVEKFCPPPCVADVRCAPKDGPLGFGGWRGAIRSIILELPPPDARYYLDTRTNEIAAEVADAMRVHCERRDALYVKGIR